MIIDRIYIGLIIMIIVACQSPKNSSGQSENVIDKIEIYATNPKQTESFAGVRMKNLKEGFESNDESYGKDFFRTTIEKRKKISEIQSHLDDLVECMEVDSHQVNVRVLVELIYSNGKREVLAVENIKSQMIYYEGVFYKHNASLYKAILKLLPFRFRSGVSYIKSGPDDCDR